MKTNYALCSTNPLTERCRGGGHGAAARILRASLLLAAAAGGGCAAVGPKAWEHDLVA